MLVHFSVCFQMGYQHYAEMVLYLQCWLRTNWQINYVFCKIYYVFLYASRWDINIMLRLAPALRVDRIDSSRLTVQDYAWAE